MKTKIYILIFVVLAAFAAYTLLKSDSDDDFWKERAFKVENFEDVTEIKITDRNGDKVHFKKEKNDWILNEKYPVREHLFSEMKEALTKMEAWSPVPKIGADAVLKQMVAGALKVEVYKGKKLDKVIHIGGPNIDNSASHMFLEIDGKASKQIYNVGIPGFRGFLTTRFVVDEDEWRSKNIFSYSLNEVKKIEVKYFNLAKHQDFVLELDDNNFDILTDNKRYSTENLNQKSIANYLVELKQQDVLGYEFTSVEDLRMKDSLLHVNKYAELSITDNNKQVQKLIIIDMPLNEQSKQQYDANGDPMKYDVDYKYIIFGEKKDWGIITNSNFGLLLVDPSIFLK